MGRSNGMARKGRNGMMVSVNKTCKTDTRNSQGGSKRARCPFELYRCIQTADLITYGHDRERNVEFESHFSPEPGNTTSSSSSSQFLRNFKKIKK